MKIALRIIDGLPIPPGTAEAPLTGPWKGAFAHVGPERLTPLKEALFDKTGAALYTLYSGVLLWSAVRLQPHANVAPLYHLAEALFAWQQDWRWFGRPAKIADIDRIDEAPRGEASVLCLLDLIHQDHIYENGMWPPEPMFSTVAEAITLTRHNLPKPAKTVFEGWVQQMIDRLNAIAPFPEHGQTPPLESGDTPARRAWAAKVMGQPLPPSVLDVAHPAGPAGFAGEWAEVLGLLDWQGNPYLRRPDGPPKPRDGAPGP